MIWQICFGSLPPLGFEESKQYAKSETKPSLPAFFPFQHNPYSILDDEKGLHDHDQENQENRTPRKKVRMLPETSVSVPWGIGRWGLINAI